MKFSYDPRYNIAYICLQEKPVQVESVRLSEELVVDMAPDGTIYGIELLNANEQLRREDMGRLLVVNPLATTGDYREATGEMAEVPLAIA